MNGVVYAGGSVEMVERETANRVNAVKDNIVKNKSFYAGRKNT